MIIHKLDDLKIHPNGSVPSNLGTSNLKELYGKFNLCFCDARLLPFVFVLVRELSICISKAETLVARFSISVCISKWLS